MMVNVSRDDVLWTEYYNYLKENPEIHELIRKDDLREHKEYLEVIVSIRNHYRTTISVIFSLWIISFIFIVLYLIWIK